MEPGGVWRTESRKEKVWETGLRLSPVIRARLLFASPGLVAAEVTTFGSLLFAEAFSSFAVCAPLPDKE